MNNKNADYRKKNDRSCSSSTYHKKDGTCHRAILKEEAQRIIDEYVNESNEKEDNKE